MKKILLVEDNELNRDMLFRRLLKSGYQVVVAVDGDQAISVTRQELPDLILMDISLPDMSGLDVTRILKADGSTAGIPIIALTAHAIVGDRERILAAGCDEYETKPIKMARLLSIIADFTL